jgi:hypothetical protein
MTVNRTKDPIRTEGHGQRLPIVMTLGAERRVSLDAWANQRVNVVTIVAWAARLGRNVACSLAGWPATREFAWITARFSDSQILRSTPAVEKVGLIMMLFPRSLVTGVP